MSGKILVALASVTAGMLSGLSMGQTTGPANVAEILEERAQLDATVFANEVAAQRHEETFVRLWDELRNKDPFTVLAALPFETLTFAEPKPMPSQDWGLQLTAATLQPDSERKPRTYSQAEARAKLERWKAAGWKIDQTEWHHSEFRPGAEGAAPASRVSFEIHATLASTSPERLIIRGTLDVQWSGKDDTAGRPVIGSMRAEDVILLRQQQPPLEELLTIDPKQLVPGQFPRVSPIIAADLNSDGRSDVILAGCNVVLRNEGNMQFEKAVFLKHPIIRPAEAGILADFTGDAIPDYIGCDAEQGKLLLFKGARGGAFPHQRIVCFDAQLDHLHALTAGDIDGDGDLDLYAGQWKAPYVNGEMPTPYWAANDGHPDYLLVNDGKGKFTDHTIAGGLENKRNRRTFSASFVDLNGDHHLDLIVVADFAGMDAYLNSGDGTFADATETLLQERSGFGMAHTLADFDVDGAVDLFMVGMSSTTARRLDRLQLGRPGFEDHDRMRAPMAFGNRLLLRNQDPDAEPQYIQPSYANSSARSGWSWGCTAADFDIDGDMDIFVSNGHLSGGTAKDYCTRFWCHDLYTGNSSPDKVINSFFQQELLAKLGTEYSWNGFEHNVLYLNQPRHGFLNASFLAGVAGEFDARAALADDLNFDGKPDLLVVEYDAAEQSQKLHVYANVLPQEDTKERSWIGARLYGGPDCPSPMGAIVTVKAGGKTYTRQIISGDSFTAQHAAAVVFGIGNATKLDEVEVRWHNGLITRSNDLSVNHYLGFRGVKQ